VRTAEPSADGRRSTAIFGSNCHRRGHIVSPPPRRYFVHFASAAVAVDSKHKTAPSPASWSRFSLPSNFVNGHVSTVWFMHPLVLPAWRYRNAVLAVVALCLSVSVTSGSSTKRLSRVGCGTLRNASTSVWNFVSKSLLRPVDLRPSSALFDRRPSPVYHTEHLPSCTTPWAAAARRAGPSTAAGHVDE